MKTLLPPAVSPVVGGRNARSPSEIYCHDDQHVASMYV